jgi:hypothetical protein
MSKVQSTMCRPTLCYVTNHIPILPYEKAKENDTLAYVTVNIQHWIQLAHEGINFSGQLSKSSVS